MPSMAMLLWRSLRCRPGEPCGCWKWLWRAAAAVPRSCVIGAMSRKDVGERLSALTEPSRNWTGFETDAGKQYLEGAKARHILIIYGPNLQVAEKLMFCVR